MPGNGNKNPWGGQGNGSGGNNPPPRNPWGNQGGNQGNNQGGGQGGGSSGGEPPDLDAILRRAQNNFGRLVSGPDGGSRLLLLLCAVIAALWLISGFYIVNPGESAVVQRFGKLHRTQATEGLGYRWPWPVESLQTLNVSQIRRMSVGFIEQADSQPRDVPEESLMLTSDANIVDLDMVVLWNIKSARDYLFTISEPENTIKKVAESAIREVVGQLPMLPIITNARAEIADKARRIMQQNLDFYHSGVNVSQVLIQKAEVHPDVQEAFQDVQSAKQDAINTQNQAETYRQDILPKARGRAIQLVRNAEAYRDSSIAKATGAAKKFDQIYQSYQLGPGVTRTRLYLETMEDVMSRAHLTILDTKAGAVLPYLPSIEGRTPAAKELSEAKP